MKFYRDEKNDDENEIDGDGNKIDNNKTTTIKSFKCNSKLIQSTANNNSRLNKDVAFPLKYFSSF